jgi:hypothetical protein
MSERDQQVQAVAEELRKAVFELQAGDRPLNPGLTADFWPSVGKASIVNWVDDAERACAGIARALDLVDTLGQTDATRDALEGALWRITATREKLEAVFVLCFGIPSLEPYRKTSARFEPNTEGIKAKLRELAGTHPAAHELGDIGAQLAGHPAVTLRDQLSHQLAAIGDVAELCWIDIAHMRGNGIIGWSGGPFYAEKTIDQGPITREANWARAVGSVEECLRLLVRSFELMAELVRAAAVLEPPQRVYKDEDTGAISTTDPRAGWSGEESV